jgi:hypothetical protein
LKDSTVRIDSVLALIQTTTVVPAPVRTEAYNLVNNFITTDYPAINAGHAGYETFSKAMSLGFHLGKDTDNLRNMKRACFMLGSAIKKAEPGAKAPNIGTIVNPNIAFPDAMRKAACVQGVKTGTTAGAQGALTYLKDHPLEFLQTNKLIVKGTTRRDLTQGDANVLNYNFGFRPDKDTYEFNQTALQGYYGTQVDSITAMHFSLVPGGHDATAAGPLGDFSQIPGIRLTSDIMITTQFTGCAFCMSANNGVYCAHVAPVDRNLANAPVTDGNLLSRRIAVNGNFANAHTPGGLSIYGSGFSQNLGHGAGTSGYPRPLEMNYMTVIGVRHMPTYAIYAQVTGLDDGIAAAKRIL